MTKYNYNFDPTYDYSKVDMQDFTGLSKGTINEALGIAGLPTSQRKYRGQDLLDRFVPVRRMFESGMTKVEIEQQIKLRTANVDDRGDSTAKRSRSAAEPPQPTTADFAGIDRAIGEGVQDALTGLVEAAVTDFVDHLPGITAVALAQAAESGQIRAAFTSRLQEYYRERGAMALPASSTRHSADPLAFEPHMTGYDDDGANIPFIEEADDFPQDDEEASDTTL